MRNDEKKCPQCAEIVRREAKVCRFCSHQFSEEHVVPARKSNPAKWVLWGALGIIPLIIISSISGESTSNSNSASSSVSAPEKPEASSDESQHNYELKEGTTYGYAEGISEDDRSAGRVASELAMFQYLGKQEGLHTIVQLDSSGRVGLKSQCEDPCKFQKLTIDGKVIRGEYNTDSLGGSVMEDAIAGRLEITPKK